MPWLRGAAEKYYRTASTRLKKVSGTAVLSWADSSLWATQAGLDGWRATTDRAALEEARLGAVGLLAAIDNLLDRHPD